MSQVKIKPLLWKRAKLKSMGWFGYSANGKIAYDLIQTSSTPHRWMIFQYWDGSAKFIPNKSGGVLMGKSPRAAKAAAQRHWNKTVMGLLEVAK